jgi:hypothetical protein
MKYYKLVRLNDNFYQYEDTCKIAEKKINEYVEQGWELQQLMVEKEEKKKIFIGLFTKNFSGPLM